MSIVNLAIDVLGDEDITGCNLPVHRLILLFHYVLYHTLSAVAFYKTIKVQYSTAQYCTTNEILRIVSQLYTYLYSLTLVHTVKYCYVPTVLVCGTRYSVP